MFTEVSVVMCHNQELGGHVRIREASLEIFKRYIFVAIKRWDVIFWYSALNGASTI
jgi:hypothetical protein